MDNPAGLYRLEPGVDLADNAAATMLVSLAGFLDAGHTQRLISEHLFGTLEHRLLATFDVDQLLDYRGRRPLMHFNRDHWESYAEPTLSLYRLTDDDGVPFLLFAGPEPDYQWERVIAAVRELAAALGVRLTLSISGIPVAVPHTRPVGSSFHGTNEERRSAHEPLFGAVDVPGHLAGLLELRLGQDGQDALGYAVHVPHYVAGSDFPAAAVVGIQLLADTAGLRIADSALRLAAVETGRLIDEEVSRNPEIGAVILALEEQYDAHAGVPSAALLDPRTGRIPTGEQLGDELEAFLRNRDEGA